jgi:hypothetical protein
MAILETPLMCKLKSTGNPRPTEGDGEEFDQSLVPQGKNSQMPTLPA